MTLEPCDVIATGTIAEAGFAMTLNRTQLRLGDMVKIEIGKITIPLKTGSFEKSVFHISSFSTPEIH